MKKILIILLAAAGIQAASGQGFIKDSRLSSSLYVKTLRANGVQTTLVALPEVYRAVLSDNLSLDAVSIPVLALSNADGGAIARLANTKARLAYNFKDMVLATVGAKVPVGTNQFSANQEKTAAFLGTRQFAFRNANVYNTLDISGSVSSSMAFKDLGSGDLSVGLGVAVLVKMPFEPREGTDISFDPGDELSVSLAGEYVFLAMDQQVKTMADLGFTIYGKDQLGDDVTTEVGGRFNWAVAGASKLMDLPVNLRLANYIKGANKADRVGTTTKKSTDFITTVRAGLPILQEYRPHGLLRLAYYGGGNVYDNSAFITTLGGGGSLRLGERMFASGELGLDLGGYGDAFVWGVSLEGGINYVF